MSKLMHLKNFKQYKTEQVEYMGRDLEIFFVKSECGKDWYEIMPKLSKDTYKVLYHATSKQVMQVETDASYITPTTGTSLIELDKVPEGNLLSPGAYSIKNDKVVFNTVADEQALENNKHLRDSLMSIATAHIETLKSMGKTLTDRDVMLWIDYRIAVYKTDCTVRDPVWPKQPG